MGRPWFLHYVSTKASLMGMSRSLARELGPLGITVNTVLTTLRLPPQTLTTADGNSVVMSAIIKYRVEDVAAYVTQIWDATDVLADVSMGTVRERVQKASWSECLNGDLSNEVTIAVRRAVKRFGFAVESITFTDFGRVRSLRLIQQPVTNLEN
jgi:regulator of protease activity HflC (stomatin/prohibitin superfamily)